MKVNDQFQIADEIISDMERYRGLVDILIVKDSEEYARAEAEKFNDYLRLFRHFYSEDEGMDLDKELEQQQDTTIEIPLDSTLLEALDLETSN